MSPRPAGKRVGGETGMNQCKIDLVVGVGQVEKVIIELGGCQQTFVDDCLCGEAGNVSSDVVLIVEVGCAFAGDVASLLEV